MKINENTVAKTTEAVNPPVQEGPVETTPTEAQLAVTPFRIKTRLKAGSRPAPTC
jgi:hypothetical protein